MIQHALSYFCDIDHRILRPQSAAAVRLARLLGFKGGWLHRTYVMHGHGMTLAIDDHFFWLTED